MRRRPNSPDSSPVITKVSSFDESGKLGLILSGGGSRAAYQAGALRALQPYLGAKKNPFSIIMGSSIGAINGLVIGSTIKNGLTCSLDTLEELWSERTWRNTFAGNPSAAFFRAIKMATIQYLSPGPNATDFAIFNPAPLMQRIDEILTINGGLTPEARDPNLEVIAVMTTVEGAARRPLLFASTHKRLSSEILEGADFEICYRDNLHAKHGFASAALPSVLPPVEIDTDDGKVKLVDGGISINIPVDPAVRFGAEKAIIIDISGRSWWLDQSGESHDTRPTWEVPATTHSYCLRPPETFTLKPKGALGSILKASVSKSKTRFIKSLGPIWPVFSLLKNKVGEEVAYEAMTYVALDEEYVRGLLEAGYHETKEALQRRQKIEFSREKITI
jgi:predicted acylesterase/phospholipase RssA